MAEGQRDEAWDHTAALLAMLSNLHREKGQRALSPDAFHPSRARSDRDRQRDRLPVSNKQAFAMMKATFCKD